MSEVLALVNVDWGPARRQGRASAFASKPAGRARAAVRIATARQGAPTRQATAARDRKRTAPEAL